MHIACDYETKSKVDLRAHGLHNYAEDKSTGIHCFSWGTDPFEIQTWHEGDRFPDELREHVARGGIFTAWNAPFELYLWNLCAVKRYGWPPVKVSQFRCSMARAYAMSLPGALEKAANALGVEQRKDMAGARIMMQLAQPKADGSLWQRGDDDEKFEKLYGYNRQDVRTELAVCERLMELSPNEQALWELDFKINSAGIQIDLPSVNAAIRLVEAEKARLDKEMLRTTGGVVGKCTEVQLLIKWIRTQDVAIEGVAKADVLDALNGDLPAPVRAALNLRKEAAKSSTAKLIAMRDRASADGRVRGTMQYHGASTGRWAGRGIQVQNFPRGDLKPAHVADAIAHFGDRDYLDMMYAAPMDVISSCLRGMIVAKPGHDLLAADFSNIEGRVLAWLAGEEWKLQAFRDFDAGTGPDLYNLIYAESFGVPVESVTKTQRQIGKVEELAFGFGGGVGAGQSMARIYNVTVEDATMDGWKVAWRNKHPRIVRYWYDVEGAFKNALDFGVVCKAGPKGRQVTFKKDGSFLWCKLPSGRVLCYPYAEINTAYTMTKGGKTRKVHPSEYDKALADSWRVTRTDAGALWYMSVNGTTNKWEWTNTYSGSIVENLTQAVARDLLAHALVRLSDNGFPTVMHIHDEAVLEIPSDSDKNTLERIETLMAQTPAWAEGLPVSAEGWRAARYQK